MHITFDTLEMVRRLEAKGFKREQAEEIISVVKDVQQDLATKQDIDVLRKDITALELRLTVKLGSIIGVAMTLFTAIIGLLIVFTR